MGQLTPFLTSSIAVTLAFSMTSEAATGVNYAYVTMQAFPDTVLPILDRVYVTETACQCKSHCISNLRCVGVSVTLQERNVTCSMTFDPAGALSLYASQDHVTFFKDVTLGDQAPVVSGTAPATPNIFDTSTAAVPVASTTPGATPDSVATAATTANAVAATTTTTQTTDLPTTTTDSTTTADPSEDYYTLTEEGTREECTRACLKQGRHLATITTQEDLDKFMAFWPSAGGGEIHLSLIHSFAMARWKLYNVPFSSSELGQLFLPFSLNGSTALYAAFDTTTKAITHFLRWSAGEALAGTGVHCMNEEYSTRNYQHFELTYSPGFAKAAKECRDRGQRAALYASLAEYTKLVAQAPPSVPYNALALRFTGMRKRLEWISPTYKVQYTPLNHLTPSTDGLGGCYFPEKVTTTTPHTVRFNRGRCETEGKGVCMPIPKIEPGMYTFSVHSFAAGRDPWFEARRFGLQLAVLKTPSHVVAVFAQIDAAEWTQEYYHVALHWNDDLSLLMWEDDTPYNLTPLASDPMTQEQPADDSDCYYLHQQGGQFRGFFGGNCDHSSLLAMRKA